MTSPLPIIQSFLDYLTDERHFSPYTARCYGADLRQFVEQLTSSFGINIDKDKELAVYQKARDAAGPADVAGSIQPDTVTKHILAADADTIRDFLQHLADQNYSAATMARKIATLRSFYKWAHKRDLTDSNPMTMIRTPRQAKRLPFASSAP
ncbi:MAG: site-specific integrase, partial [Planctomycetota bacterium]